MTKPSDSKGFWEGVTVTPQGVTEGNRSLEVTPFVTPPEIDPTRHAYKSMAKFIRSMHERILTPTGRPKKGPKFIAVTLCAEENEYGLTDARQTKGKRFACKTCFSFAPTIWSDGEAPSREEQEQEWADWAARVKEDSDVGRIRTKLRAIGVLGRDQS